VVFPQPGAKGGKPQFRVTVIQRTIVIADPEQEVIMWNRAGRLLAVAGLLPGLLGMSSPTTAAAAPDQSAFSFLTGTIALSPSDAWAVGWTGASGTTFIYSSALHWNGHTWAGGIVAKQFDLDGLDSVSATGPLDVWAVGFLDTGSLIEHYNGHKWAMVACPCQRGTSELNGVDARTTSDAWAVGYIQPSGKRETPFAQHWNGSTWAQVPTAPLPASYTFPEFTSVLDLGPGNVLAVGGYYTKLGGKKSVQQALAEHWNGQAWQQVSVPAFSTASYLASISGSALAGVTAAGGVSSGGHDIPVIDRWNGTGFVQVTQPVTAGDLSAVTVLSSTSAYAAGNTGSTTTLAEHYNGTQWTQVPTPSPSGAYFSGIAVDPSGQFAVAVGAHGPTGSERSLIEQGNGQTWTITRQ
jgi:hypothetical protein